MRVIRTRLYHSRQLRSRDHRAQLTQRCHRSNCALFSTARLARWMLTALPQVALQQQGQPWRPLLHWLARRLLTLGLAALRRLRLAGTLVCCRLVRSLPPPCRVCGGRLSRTRGIRQHMSAYVSIRQHSHSICQHMPAYVRICQDMSGDVRIREDTSGYVRIREDTSGYL
jgi:hypothetical protein